MINSKKQAPQIGFICCSKNILVYLIVQVLRVDNMIDLKSMVEYKEVLL